MASPSQLHELLAPVEDRKSLVVEERPAEVLALLLRGAAGDRGERDLHGGPLPEVLILRLDHRDILAAQAVFEGSQGLAFVLQARREGQFQFQPYRAEQRPPLPRDLNGLEELEHVALFDVVKVLDADAALETLAYRAHVVPEALEGGYVALVDHGTVAHEADAVVAEDLTARHHTARNDADVRNAEGLAHFGGARLALLNVGGEHASHGCFDLLERLVDHVVGPDLDAFALGDLLGRVGRPDVEPEQDAVGRAREHDIGVGERPDAAANDVHPNLIGSQLGERLL